MKGKLTASSLRSIPDPPTDDGAAAGDTSLTDDPGFEADDTAPSCTREDLPSLADEALGALPQDEHPSTPGEAVESEDDLFREIPTVSNRANPTLESADNDFSPANEPHTGVGAYRLVRPATSDRIDVHQPTAGARTQSNRVIIGISRKSKA
jgi:hypothetical protein